MPLIILVPIVLFYTAMKQRWQAAKARQFVMEATLDREPVTIAT